MNDAWFYLSYWKNCICKIWYKEHPKHSLKLITFVKNFIQTKHLLSNSSVVFKMLSKSREFPDFPSRIHPQSNSNLVLAVYCACFSYNAQNVTVVPHASVVGGNTYIIAVPRLVAKIQANILPPERHRIEACQEGRTFNLRAALINDYCDEWNFSIIKIFTFKVVSNIILQI